MALISSNSGADEPVLQITNTHAGTSSGELRFNKDSASGGDSDVMGLISFYGTDDSDNTHERLAYMDAIITDSAHGSEAASLRFYVAENDATLTQGLLIAGQADSDGEVDVTIGAGAASLTTIAGDLDIPNGGFALGSDATGDVYYRNGSGVLTRLAVGSDDEVLTLASGVPSWAAATSLSGLGSTDNALLRANGTGGATAQGSSILIDDSDNMSAVGTLATTGAVTIAAAGGLAGLGAGGNEFSITESSDDITIQTLISDKDMIFKVNDGGSATEVFRLNGDVSTLLMASGKELQFADDGEHISGDGSTLSIVSEAGSIAIGAALADGQTLKLGKNGAVETIIAPHGTAGNEKYSVINTAGTADGTNSNAAALQLTATAGGLGLAWADDKDLWAEGGRAVITANEDAADCIKLHADAGTSQTITIVNDAGTNAAAIALNAAAGGITLDAEVDIILDANGGDIYFKDGGTTKVNFDMANAVIYPESDNSIDLGKSDKRFKDIYTMDLHLNNDRGNWTIVEEADMLTIRNNHTGKWYMMNMTEIDPTGRDEGMATPPTS